MARKHKDGSNAFLYVVLFLFLLIGFTVYKIFSPNTGSLKNGEYLYVPTGATYDKMLAELEEGGYVKDMWSFRLFAWQSQMKTHVHPGKYHFAKGMSNLSIIRILRSGRQTPVKLVINKLRTKSDFLALIAANLECPVDSMAMLINDNDYLNQYGLDTATVMAGIVPDTYQFFWNTNADKAFKKIIKNYIRVWDRVRTEKAKHWELSPVQIVVVASIVEEETNSAGDKPFIASVYLNRLKKGMKLQADPTVKYAVGDFAIRRVAGEMLNNSSPYNTYKYEGLPPGPICTPSLSTIDAVLNAPETNYLYFCAKADFSGNSAFAATLDEQMKNAHAYQKALDARGIH